MAIMASRPLARWLAPLSVAAVLAGGGLAARAMAAAAPALPSRSASALLADLATARVDGLSGTLSETADFGLPQLPGIGGDAEFTSLISGTHTLKFWYAGPRQVRIAVLGSLAESDAIRDGSDVWLWSSRKNTVAHASVPSPSPSPGNPSMPPHLLPSPLPSPLAKGLGGLPLSPQDAVSRLLALVGPTTDVTVGPDVTVAGRSAYQLRVAPKDHSSLVRQITVAIDATQHVPLRIQVYAKNYAPPAFSIGFTSVSFTKPKASVFAFTPPAGATVTEIRPDVHAHPGASPGQPGGSKPAGPAAASIGSAWTTIVAVRPPSGSALGGPSPAPGSTPAPSGPAGQLKALLGALPTVRGPFGTGKLLETRLVTVLILDDGRIIAGAVDPGRVVTAATNPKLALK